MDWNVRIGVIGGVSQHLESESVLYILFIDISGDSLHRSLEYIENFLFTWWREMKRWDIVSVGEMALGSGVRIYKVLDCCCGHSGESGVDMEYSIFDDRGREGGVYLGVVTLSDTSELWSTIGMWRGVGHVTQLSGRSAEVGSVEDGVHTDEDTTRPRRMILFENAGINMVSSSTKERREGRNKPDKQSNGRKIHTTISPKKFLVGYEILLPVGGRVGKTLATSTGCLRTTTMVEFPRIGIINIK
ncbi:hypothetical protein Tco_0639837 [Tanacetum coccineum]